MNGNRIFFQGMYQVGGRCVLSYGVSAALVGVLAWSAIASPIAASEASPPDPRTAINDAIRSQRVQTELPGIKKEELEKKLRDRGPARRPASDTPSISAASANTMLWIALAVFLLVLVMTIVENLRLDKRVRNRKSSEPEADRDAVKERMAVARKDADVLAESENYADAMHTLLLQSLNEMRRRLGISFAASLTSREILRRTSLDQAAHTALSDIIARVEISYFGSHKPTKEEYLACRQSYATLTRVLQQGGRA